METAKVDIRKLQLLNDRINQTIEALNQVRLSVHGLSQSPGGPFGMPQVGYPLQGSLGAGYGVSPFGLPGAYSQLGNIPGIVPGMSHTAGYGGLPFGLPGVLSQQAGIPGIIPGLSQLSQTGGYGVSPFGLPGPYAHLGNIQGMAQGLSHSGSYGGLPFGFPGAYSQQGSIPGVNQGLSQAGSYGGLPFGFPGAYSQQGSIPGVNQGLSHTAGYGLVPQLQSLAGLQNPLLAQSLIPGALAAGQIPQVGLGHSSPEFLEANLATRQALALTFPFANWNYSPFLAAQ